jgi:TonB-linked SusC/RagA family outer membrane protein
MKNNTYCQGPGRSMPGRLLLLLCFQLCMISTVFAQTIPVSGTVSDSKGAPLKGVSVNVKGTTNGTTTDDKGAFKISVANAQSVLVFSFVGYTPKEQPVGAKTTFSIQLQEGDAGLEQVVVVGYGTQKKRDVTGAISSVSAKQIEERQAIDVLDAMQGQAPGLQIAQESGRPGAGSSVRIRGIGTFQGGADPLYIVDGAQGVNIDGINPNDIESIEILKDGASAAIYGSRSANGVVIITTKRGKEGKPTLDLRYLTSINTLAHKIPQANAAERRLLDLKRGGSGGLNADSLNPSINADNDMQDLLTRTGLRHQVDLSLGGATKNLNYYGSIGYLKEEGIIVNSYADILRGRFNIDYRPSDKFSYGNRIQLSYQTENRISEGNVLNQAIQRPPNFRTYFPDGSLAGIIGGRRNPLAEALLRTNKFDIVDVSIYNYLSYNFTKALKLTVDANVKGNYTHNVQFSPKLISTANLSEGADFTDWKTYWMLQAYLNYNTRIGNDHNLGAVLGVSADQSFARGSDIEGSNYATESVITLNSPQVYGLPNTRETRNRMTSAFGRFEYNYKGRYLLTSNVRADASSRFGRANQWGYFPSVSVGWRFSDESFLSSLNSFLTDGKLRVSYGSTGNEQGGAYDPIQLYTFGGNYYNGLSGVAPSSQLGNDRLSWEQLNQFNVGLDLSLFNGRITITADYYNKITQKLLYDAPLASETGFGNVKVNVGSIQNKGLEFVVSAYPVRKKDFSWNVIYNMSFNNATIRELYGNIPVASANWKTDVGGRLGEFYGWRALGVYAYDQSNAYTEDWTQLTPVFSGGTFTGYTLDGKPYTGTVKQLRTQGSVLKGGDMIWENNKKDSVIDDADRIPLGNAQPKFIAGFSNVFNYKRFSLSFNFYVSWGGKIYNRGRQQLNTNATTNVTPDPEYINESWWHQGDVTEWAVAKNNGMGNARELSSQYLEDASFIRLRNARITYALPTSIASKAKIRGVSVYVYGNNLLTWTNYNWYDPEINFNNPLQMGQDNGRYPRKREFGAGINVNF